MYILLNITNATWEIHSVRTRAIWARRLIQLSGKRIVYPSEMKRRKAA